MRFTILYWFGMLILICICLLMGIWEMLNYRYWIILVAIIGYGAMFGIDGYLTQEMKD